MSANNDISASMKAFKEAKLRLQSIGDKFTERCLKPCVLLINAEENKRLLRKDVWDSEKAKLDEMEKMMFQMQCALSREKVKLVFVGRTSSGKSTLINAILRQKILPSDPGHTTNCFISLSGGDQEEARLFCDGQQIPLEDIETIGHAVQSGNYGTNTVLHLEYPKQKCAILTNDLVMLDTPGLDNDEDLDNWLFDKCSDCDVIALVVDGTSSISRTEKKFIEALQARFLTFTNVFVAFNKWDMVIADVGSDQQKLERIRKQHEENATTFISNVLRSSIGVPCSRPSFFLSSRKILSAENAESCWKEFAAFEKVLMKTASITALQRKINHQVYNFEARISEFRNLMKRIMDRTAADRKAISKLASQWKTLFSDVMVSVEVSAPIQGCFLQIEKPWFDKVKEHVEKFSFGGDASSKEGKSECGKAIFNHLFTFLEKNNSDLSMDLNNCLKEAIDFILLQAQRKSAETVQNKGFCLCAAFDLNKLKDTAGPCTQGGACPSFVMAMKKSNLLQKVRTSFNWKDDIAIYVDEILKKAWEKNVSSMPSLRKGVEVTKIVFGTLASLTLIGALAGVPFIVDGAAKLSDAAYPSILLESFVREFQTYWHGYLKETGDRVAKEVIAELNRGLHNFVEKELVQVWERHADEFDRLDKECRALADNCEEINNALHQFHWELIQLNV